MPQFVLDKLSHWNGFLAAAISYIVIKRMFAFMEREARPERRTSLRHSLQQGTFLFRFNEFFDIVGQGFTRIFGERAFDKKSISNLFVFSSTCFLLMFTIIYLPHLLTDREELDIQKRTFATFRLIGQNPYAQMAKFVVFRFLIGLIIDFLNVAKLRYMFRFVRRSGGSIFAFVLSIATDIVFVSILYMTGNILATYLSDIDNESNIVEILPILLIAWGKHYLMMLRHPLTFDAILLYVSLAPSLIFYICCVSFVISRSIAKLLPKMTRFSSQFIFSQPYAFVGEVAACLAAALWLLAGSLCNGAFSSY